MESIARYLGLAPERRVVEGLEARFKGPRPLKSPKKKSPPSEIRKKTAKSGTKVKDRHRDRKNIGKRRKPKSAAKADEAGFKPLFKKN
jgi:hypothetical protein